MIKIKSSDGGKIGREPFKHKRKERTFENKELFSDKMWKSIGVIFASEGKGNTSLKIGNSVNNNVVITVYYLLINVIQ